MMASKKFLIQETETLMANVSGAYADGVLSRDGTEEVLAELDKIIRLIKEDY